MGRHKEQEIIERRLKVAEIRISGLRSCRKIAKALQPFGYNVSYVTVERDLQALDAQWREQAASDTASAKSMDIERLEEMLFAVWPRVRRGDLAAIESAISIIKQRAAIYGYNAPTRVTGADGKSPVQIAHTHTHHDLSGFSSEEATALFELASRYDDGGAG